jgi:hypothetical protein
MIEGGCNCKAIRYRIDAAPVIVAQCHCRNCQRQSGSAFSVNLMVPAAKVETTGALTTYVDHDTASGNPVYRRFCGQCGSPIFSDLHEGKGMTIVKAGTLDDPGAFVPALSVWTATAWPWVAPLPGVKAFAGNPG